MTERTITVGSAQGLHARPARLFTQAANASGATVTIARANAAVDEAVNATSIIRVLSLGIRQGESVRVAVEGDDADRILDELAALLSTDLDH